MNTVIETIFQNIFVPEDRFCNDIEWLRIILFDKKELLSAGGFIL